MNFDIRDCKHQARLKIIKMSVRKVGQIVVKNSAVFLCDIQEKFSSQIQYFAQIVEVSSRMFRAAKHLDMTVVTTEQYPKGLGLTVPEIGLNRDEDEIHAKTCFSMILPQVEKKLQDLDIQSVILCGIETQACVQQTALDLLQRDIDVHVIADACSSRSMVDRMYAFDRMRQSGAFITTSEAMMLQLLKDAKHPKFKECQKLIMTSAPDSGLLPGQGS